MKTRCPACGATSSLDALLGHSEASQAFKSCLGLVGELQTPLVKYLALFRPDSRDLTFDRAAKLLNELAPDIVAKQIQRNRQTFPAPLGAWVWAIGVVLERRDQGKIDLPLKSHGYLYEVISSYKPEYSPVQDATLRKSSGVRAAHVTSSVPLVTEKSFFEREQELREHQRCKTEPVTFTVADLVAKANADKPKANRTLNNIPPSQVFAHVGKNRRDGETHNECFERLLAEQEQGATT